MASRAFNARQRIVVVIALGAGLYFFGSWATTRGEVGSPWVAYAPLSENNSPDFSGGLPAWARLLIWLVLITIWAGAGVLLLRSRATEDPSQPVD
jgi:hypothetical protein